MKDIESAAQRTEDDRTEDDRAELPRLRSEVGRLQALLAEERRRASEVERRYRGLVDRLDAIFWEADVESFEFVYVSPRAEAILGYPMERWMGEPGFWPKILHPDDRDWVVQCCVQATAEGRDNDFEYRAVAADGRVVWLRDLVYLERDGEGRPRLMRGVMIDITPQKRIEEALRASGEAKDQFLAMLAHELRNPLGALGNAVEVMRASRPGEEPWERAFEVVERQVRHQGELLNDLLEVSRLMGERREPRRERLDLQRLVAEAAEKSRPGFEQRGLGFTVELPGEPLPVEGDPEQLSQALRNILHNAAKFTAAGGSVGLRAAREAAGGRGRATVTVTDTGIGIDPALLPRVWEAFSQADRSLERTRGGLGLGLAQVKGWIELHGGEVRAESAGLGMGAAFTVTLPLAAVTSLLVLVIEDNADAAETLGDLLDLFGYRVEVASSGPAGLEAARRLRPDVVLCDIGLPGMDGYAVARELRADPAAAGARLVALTGYGGDSDRRRAQEAGFDLHLVKPVAPSELKDLLDGWAAGK